MKLECSLIPVSWLSAQEKKRRYWRWAASQINSGIGLSLIASYYEKRLDVEIDDALKQLAPFCVLAITAKKLVGNLPLLDAPTAVLATRLHDWVGWRGQSIYTPDYFICATSWENLLTPLKQSAVFSEAVQLKKYAMRFREMPLYNKFIVRIKQGDPPVRNGVMLTSTILLDAYFTRYVRLFESIQAQGLVSQTNKRGFEKMHFSFSGLRSKVSGWFDKDIGVAVGPNGQLVALPGGKHRASIAIVLGLPVVPVQVRMVHVDWLRSLNRSRNLSWQDAILEGVNQLGKLRQSQGYK